MGKLLIAAIPPMHGHAKEESAPESEEHDMGDDDGGERDAFEGFAEAAGIPEEKRDDAFAALKDMIHICYANAEKSESSEG